jgi:hypothetical protein
VSSTNGVGVVPRHPAAVPVTAAGGAPCACHRESVEPEVAMSTAALGSLRLGGFTQFGQRSD